MTKAKAVLLIEPIPTAIWWPSSPVALQLHRGYTRGKLTYLGIEGYATSFDFSTRFAIPLEAGPVVVRYLVRSWLKQQEGATGSWRFFLQYQGAKEKHDVTARTQKLPAPPTRLTARQAAALRELAAQDGKVHGQISSRMRSLGLITLLKLTKHDRVMMSIGNYDLTWRITQLGRDTLADHESR